jgi:hypothetical protein
VSDAQSAPEEQAPDRPRDVGGLVELVADLDVVRQNGLEAGQIGFDGLHDRERRGIRSFGYGDVYGAATIDERVSGLNVGTVFDRSDVADEDRLRSLRADRNVVEAFNVPDNGVDRYRRPQIADAHVPRWADRVAGGQRPHHPVRRHVVGSQLAGIQANEDRALTRAEGRRRRNARQGRKQGAYSEERRILKLGNGFDHAGKNQVADRHTACVKPHHERGHGSGGHEGAGAVDVGDCLRRGLRHVRVGMELQLDQRNALDRFAFDVLDAGDVEEVVLVVIGDEPFHLRWVQAAIRLRHIQHGHAQIREDVPRHAIERQKPRQYGCHNRNEERDRPSQCKRHQVHRAASVRGHVCTTERPWLAPAQ